MATFGVTQAQDKAKGEPAKESAPAKSAAAPARPAPQKGPRIAVEPAEFDFGKSLQNKELTREFSIRNFGNEDLVIDNVSTSCGCTAAVPGEKTVKPGGSTPLDVKLQTRTATGKIERSVLIRSNDPSHAVFTVK